MKSYMKTLCLFSTIIASSGLIAQDSIPPKNHMVSVELLGKTLFIGSLNYEYIIFKKFSIGAGFGYNTSQSDEVSRYINGDYEHGTSFDLKTTQMIYANYFLGDKKNRMLFTLGATHFLATIKQTYPSETIKTSDSQVRWNVGVGYQFTQTHGFFRASAYVIRWPEPAGDWFPKVVPWIGFTLGARF